MSIRWYPGIFFFLFSLALIVPAVQLGAQSSSSRPRAGKPVAESSLDPGSVSNGIYRNNSLGFTCKIPEGWVLRTDVMNAEQNQNAGSTNAAADPDKPVARNASSAGAKVLLAAFSRPPEAKGEEVNSSVLIAAEPVAAYPGLKEAAQYFGPLSEVAEAQGFQKDEDPYEVAIGAQTLVQGDFHKDVGTRVMRQSTLVMLSHGYAVSITMIAGSDDGVEDLIDGLDFPSPRRGAK
jgi:hypothetical protein